MPREKETYQLNLERVLEHFAGKEVLTKADVMEYLGVGRQGLDSLQLPFKHAKAKPGKRSGGNYLITAASLASWLS